MTTVPRAPIPLKALVLHEVLQVHHVLEVEVHLGLLLVHDVVQRLKAAADRRQEEGHRDMAGQQKGRSTWSRVFAQLRYHVNGSKNAAAPFLTGVLGPLWPVSNCAR